MKNPIPKLYRRVSKMTAAELETNLRLPQLLGVLTIIRTEIWFRVEQYEKATP